MPGPAEPTGRRRLTVGVGSATARDADLVLTISPQHPSAHGALRLLLTLDGERVVTAEPAIGYLHRGAEKLFEARDYRQLTMLANRHDWHSAFASELGVVLAVERMLGLHQPERAVWLRTLLAELTRLLSHLAFLGPLPGAGGPALAASWRARESVQAVLEEACGGRIHVMFNRVGGLKEDVPAGWPGRVRAALGSVRAELPALDDGLARAAGRLAGVGVLDRDTAESFGASGPVGRASGLDMDLRRDEPYLAYGELAPVPVAVRDRGDALARVECLREQVDGAMELVERCLVRLPEGPVSVRLPKTVRPPEGSIYCWTENPSGLMGYYLVSRGEPTPYRVHLRTASFNNVALLPRLAPGTLLGDLPALLASLFYVVGDLDK